MNPSLDCNLPHQTLIILLDRIWVGQLSPTIVQQSAVIWEYMSCHCSEGMKHSRSSQSSSPHIPHYFENVTHLKTICSQPRAQNVPVHFSCPQLTDYTIFPWDSDSHLDCSENTVIQKARSVWLSHERYLTRRCQRFCDLLEVCGRGS